MEISGAGPCQRSSDHDRTEALFRCRAIFHCRLGHQPGGRAAAGDARAVHRGAGGSRTRRVRGRMRRVPSAGPSWFWRSAPAGGRQFHGRVGRPHRGGSLRPHPELDAARARRNPRRSHVRGNCGLHPPIKWRRRGHAAAHRQRAGARQFHRNRSGASASSAGQLGTVRSRSGSRRPTGRRAPPRADGDR
jgi:hypothetical protein